MHYSTEYDNRLVALGSHSNISIFSPNAYANKDYVTTSSPTKTRTKMRASKSVADIKPYISHSSDRPASYEHYTNSDDC
ncbi:hypothetical protein N7522_013965 [Penicillium canescens]|nr:hypothetical protein N7522_013965 [Penicillium canescens]